MGPHKDVMFTHMKMKGDKVDNHFHTFHLPFLILPLFFFGLYKWLLCTFSTCIFIFPLLLFVLCAHLFSISSIFNASSFSFLCVCICFFLGCALHLTSLHFFFFCCNCRRLLFVLHIMYFCSFYGFFGSSSITFFSLIVLFFALCASSFCCALACQSHQLGTSHHMSFIIWVLLKVLCKIDSI
jgi:hypothetical protein